MVINGPNGMILSTRAPFAWVDTNVMVEIYTFGDIVDAKRNGNALDVEERRMRIQGSLWMATCLALGKALTLSYNHEALNAVGKHCPMGSNVLEWAKVTTFLFSDGGVLDGWIQGTTSGGKELGNGPRDTFMADQCALMRMKLIGRDQGALRKARARGVDALEPEQCAQEMMPSSLAREYFMRRLDGALTLYSANCPPQHRAVGEQSARVVRAVYEYIWKPAGRAEPFNSGSLFQ